MVIVQGDVNQMLHSAFALHQQGDLTGAAQMYRQIIEDDPQNYNALHLLGLIALKSKEYEAAQSLIAHAIKLCPNFAEAYYNFGLVMVGQEKIAEAKGAFIHAVKLQPDYNDAKTELWKLERSNDKKFRSQHGQDEYVYDHFFRDKTAGVFVDIGAYDGLMNNNTYFFEKDMQWSGICIEPAPVPFAQLTQNRDCVCIDVCLGETVGSADFLLIEKGLTMMSGLVDSYPDSIKEQVDAMPNQEMSTVQVEVQPLSSVLKAHDISHVDFCTIDVEGAELNILKDITHCDAFIDVLCVEDNVNNAALSQHILNLGYEYVARLGDDTIYRYKQ